MQFLYLLCLPLALATPVTKHPHGIGVGFDLKHTYGTAAISFPNGTLVGIARVDGTKQYRNTLKRLSSFSAQHPAPPYSSPKERMLDFPRREKRQFQKAIGRPASDDVEAISTLIKALKEETEKALGFTIRSAAASVPHIPAIYDEDLYDAFEYAGLEYLQIIGDAFHSTHLTYETSAAIAGHGLAVCPDIRDPDCKDKLEDTYLIIDYTKTGLLAYHTRTLKKGAYLLLETPCFDLGLGSGFSTDPDSHWNAIWGLLIVVLNTFPTFSPSKVILVGESVGDGTLRKTVDDVLEFFSGHTNTRLPRVLDSDPEFVQAKGVAEFVRRRIYLPEPDKPEGVKNVDSEWHFMAQSQERLLARR